MEYDTMTEYEGRIEHEILTMNFYEARDLHKDNI